MPLTGVESTLYLSLDSPISPIAKCILVVSPSHFHCPLFLRAQRMKPSDPSPADELPTTETPPNGSTIKPSNRWSSLKSYIKTEISLEHADVPIIACCLVSGLCDSSSYNAWSCFVSMQTGNLSQLCAYQSNTPRQHNLPCPRCIRPARLRRLKRLQMAQISRLHCLLPPRLLLLRQHAPHPP